METVASRRARAEYRARVSAIRAAVASAIRRSWAGLGDYRDDDIGRFARTVAPVAGGGQRQIAVATDRYVAQLEADATGNPVRPVGVPAAVFASQALRGAPAVDVYRRPGVTVWTALKKGRPYAAAVRSGLERALVIGDTDMQLAKTHTGRYLAETREGIVGFRRNPEPGACKLCASAASTVYRTDQLLPIHDRCNCDVEPVFGVRPPARATDAGDDRAGFAVHDHDEMGPVLRDPDYRFAPMGAK